jgi:hypothetical protein
MVRFDPEPHCILGCAENLRVTNAGQARDGIVQIDVGVIGQKLGIPGALWRIQANKHQGCRSGFLHRDAVVIYVGGKLRSGLSLTGLSEDQIIVGVGTHVEIHDHSRLRVTSGVQRIHVVHLVDAVYLLLDRSRDGLLKRLRVRTDVRG